VIGRIFLTVLLGALACLGQEQAAALTGTVIDPLGLPVPKARVQLQSDEINGPRISVQTNNSGEFRFDNLPPTNYHLEVYSLGFSTWRKNGIRLLAGQTKLLPSAVLNLGMCWSGPPIDAVEHLVSEGDLGTLRGTVLDSSGSPINGASVSLNCTACITKTNQRGEFIFSSLWPRGYVLDVSMVGFYPEFLSKYAVLKNLDRTYAPIRLEQCPAGGCERWPRPEQIIVCE
jgi:Carboxypeptidase regulatory-like domain